MYDYKPLPLKEVKIGWYNRILSTGWGAPRQLSTGAHQGRALGKFHIITSVIITSHPSLARRAPLGVTGGQREAGTGAGWPCCSAPGEGTAALGTHPGSREGPALAAGGAWTAGHCPLHPWEGLLTHISCTRCFLQCSLWIKVFGLSKRSSERGLAGQGHSELPARDRSTCRSLPWGPGCH